MNNKLNKFITSQQGRAFPCRDWIAGWLIIVLFFCPVIPGGNVCPLPFMLTAQASGEEGYEEGYEESYEEGYGDSYSMDSDEDGLSDGQEQDGIEIYVSYWDDSLGDYYYYTDYVFTDPYDADSDDDGWPDGYEYLYGYHPMDASDGNADFDGDTLSNGTEYGLGTNHNKIDTDDDGWNDGDEVLLLFTDPSDPSDPPAPDPYTVDSDEDGYSDGAEADAGTNVNDAGSFPANSTPDMAGSSPDPDPDPDPDPVTPPDPNDVDADGLPDDWESFNGYDPGNADDGAIDLDNDGLDGLTEFALGTDATNPDTDGDGLSDGAEVLGMQRYNPYGGQGSYEEMIDIYDEFGNYLYTETIYHEPEVPVYFSDPTLADSDGDRYSDKFEMENGLNPQDPNDIGNLNSEGLPQAFADWHDYQGTPVNGYEDSDGDGLANADEFASGADPFMLDTDTDGIDDNEEVSGYEISVTLTYTMITQMEQIDEATGEVYYMDVEGVTTETTPQWITTDPSNPDTDGDGWLDGWERDNGYNPTDPTDGNKDTDGDGVSDGMEKALGTDANDASDGDADSDGDGVGNATEIALGTNPGNKGDGLVDSDGDGVSNAQEEAIGTNPGAAPVDANGAAGEPYGEYGVYTEVCGMKLSNSMVADFEGNAGWMQYGGISLFDGTIIQNQVAWMPIGPKELYPELEESYKKKYALYEKPKTEMTRVSMGAWHAVPGAGLNAKAWVNQGDPNEVTNGTGDYSGTEGEVMWASTNMKVLRLSASIKPLKDVTRNYLLVSESRPISGGDTAPWTVTGMESTSLTIKQGSFYSKKAIVLAPPLQDKKENRVSLLPVEILIPKEGSTSEGFVAGDLVSTDKLKVAKWEDAFEGTVASPTVKANFNERDVDRFYLKVPMPWNKGAGTAKIKIKVGTDSETTDPENEIELTELQSDPGVFVSKGQILVSNDVDDEYPSGKDETLQDFTHKAKLGDKITVTFVDSNGQDQTFSADVPATHTVKIGRYKVGKFAIGSYAFGDFQINEMMQGAQELFAQIGLSIEDETISNASSLTFSNLGIDITDGLQLKKITLPSGDVELASEGKSFLNKWGSKDASIRVFFLNYWNFEGSVNPHSQGTALFNQSPYNNNVFISEELQEGDSRFFQVTPHEIGHVLTQMTHIDEDIENPSVNHITNLMTGWDLNVTDSVTAAKRLTKQQATTIYSHDAVKKNK